jgi:hypothetical protein
MNPCSSGPALEVDTEEQFNIVALVEAIHRVMGPGG